ncbi:hypothetical protein [Nocardia lasii]|uniref:Uncharacterized protein n=1 Tax=Nocardia lasii TaxID=1616107 RepID=A0ABW1JNY5_9NOCA
MFLRRVAVRATCADGTLIGYYATWARVPDIAITSIAMSASITVGRD